MPCDYKKYPANWKKIRADILHRAGHKCEACGVANYAVGARDLRQVWHDEDDIEGMGGTEGEMLFGEYPKIIKIILTISHTDHDITNNDPDNLKALCQLHHLRHDAGHHAASAAKTRMQKRNQPSLFDI